MSLKPVSSKKTQTSQNQTQRTVKNEPIATNNFETLIKKTISKRPSSLSINAELEDLSLLENILQEQPTLENYNKYQTKIRHIISDILPQALKIKTVKNQQNSAIYEVEKTINDELAIVYRSLLSLNKNTKVALFSMNAIRGLIVNELR